MTLEKLLKDKLHTVMYHLAVAEYTNIYSSGNYQREIDFHKTSASTLISLCKDANIDVSQLQASYCGYVVVAAEDLEDYDDLCKYY